MNKILIKVLAIFLTLTMLISFAACNGSDTENGDGNNAGDAQNGDNSESGFHTITFNTKGGSTIRPIKVKHGGFATPPEDPVMDNYVFHRWETDEGRAFFLDQYKVEEDLTLEAIWIKAEDLFELAPMPDSDGIMITKVKRKMELDKIVIPKIINGKTVEGLGDNAFAGTTKDLASVIVFPDTIRYVGKEALSTSIETTIVFNGVVDHIDVASFASAVTLTNINLGKGITVIPSEAFYFCVSLRTVNIPEGVTLIEENAFEGASNILTIVLPSTLETIENSAFIGCESLKTIFFGGTTEQFDDIDIEFGNDILENAKVYYYSEQEPTSAGNFWHYDKNNTPTIW